MFSSPAASGADTFVWSYPTTVTTPFGSNAGLYTGTISGGILRSLITFNLGVTPLADYYVTSAAVVLHQHGAGTCTATPMLINSVTSAWTEAGTWWNNQPTIAADTVIAPAFNLGPAGCPATSAYGDPIYITAMVERWLTGTTNYGMRLTSAAETNAAYNKDFDSGNTAAAPYLVFTYGRRPAMATAPVPANGTRFMTTSPTLSVTAAADPDGDVVKYWFKGTTGTDAVTGHLAIESGWQTATSYTVPPGLLTDGLTYTWKVYTWDGIGFDSSVTPPTWTADFVVDLHLGAEPAAPYDGLGPVQTNLVSGNALVGAGSPAGLSYAYNSATPPVTGAAVGSYYNDYDGQGDIDDTELVMERRDPSIGFVWGSGGPGGGVWADNFLVRWTASLTVPTANAPATGNYKFLASADNGMKIWVTKNGEEIDLVDDLVFDHWSGGATLPGVYSDVFTATPGETVAVRVEYKESTLIAYANVWIEGPYQPPVPPATVSTTKLAPLDPTWLGAATPPLPVGWTFSPGLGYASARVVDDHVVLTDASGASHVYSGKAGGYVPPPEEDGVLALDAKGMLTLQATDGTTYGFDAGGSISSASVPTDDGSTSSRTYEYETIAGITRLVHINDPVSERSMALRYKSFDPDLVHPTAARTCPTPGAGFGDPPPFALCQVDYWDPAGAVKTVLRYRTSQLAQIEDPGAVASPAIASTIVAPAPVRADFGYTLGKVGAVRSPLAYDAVQSVVGPDVPDDDDAKTVIVYVGGKVDSVTLPVPNSGAAVELARTAHHYVYSTIAPTSGVTVDGLTGTNRSVIFDTLGRTTSETRTTSPSTPDLIRAMAWDGADNLVALTDPANRRTVTTYDGDAVRAHASGRPTESFGPALLSCYSGYTPTCATTMPHAVTAYDTANAGPTSAWTGLAATYWDNRTLAGDTSVAGVRGGPADHDLAPLVAGSPLPAALPSDLTANDWSARYTGELTVTTAGAHGFALALTGGGQLFVDDVLVIDATGNRLTTAVVVPSPASPALGVGRHRIRLDYEAPTTGTTALELRWTPPGGSSGAVPSTSVAPRYSMATASTVDDRPTDNTTRVSETPSAGWLPPPTRSSPRPPGWPPRPSPTWAAAP
jgi:YD repeat-containing protein